MACGCADRMRKYILQQAGYTYNISMETWEHDTEPTILDEDIEDHHTRLTAQIGLRIARSFWDRLEGTKNG